MAKILISGANGFVGRTLLRHLAERHELFALIRPGQPTPAIEANWIAVDLAERLDTRLLPGHVDAVIHLAQSAHYRDFPGSALDIFDVNIRSTQHLLDYARLAQASHFLFASSGGVYGTRREQLTETMPLNPLENALGYYLNSKTIAELLINSYSTFFHPVTLRLFFVYGAGQKSGMLVPGLIRKVMRGETITIQGNPGLRMNPVYVADAVRVFEPALSLSQTAIINVAGAETVSLTELVDVIQACTGRHTTVNHAESDATGDLVADITRMNTLLGVTPQIGIREGIQRTVNADSG